MHRSHLMDAENSPAGEICVTIVNLCTQNFSRGTFPRGTHLMNVEIQINNNAAPIARFVTWAASPCRIRVTNPAGITGTNVPVRLDRQGPATGGGIEFATAAAGPFAATLNISLPRNGTTVGFFVRGVFGKPSSANGDVTIRVRQACRLPLSKAWPVFR